MKLLHYFFLAAVWSLFVNLSSASEKPNVVFILADDLGYGDVGSYNPESQIPTPNLDALATGGILFTDAHTSSSVCTPSRYSFLTGRYAWRTRLKRGVLNGVSPALIEKDRMTVASLLKSEGYSTAMIGKWHLGWDFQFKGGAKPQPIPKSLIYDSAVLPIDYSQSVQNGPDVNGFDYYFGICGSLDMNPYVYVEDGVITATPDRITENSNKKKFWRKGLTGADFEHIEVMPKFVEKSVDYIKAQARKEEPFFLYLSLSGPHTPILPTEQFEGSTQTNLYGDFVAQCDYHVGEVVTALEQAGVLENTIVVFTSDNGCSSRADFKELLAVGHNPNYIYRGQKADVFEAGHRVPYIVQWPARIAPGQRSNEVVCLSDTLATVAEILDVKLPDNAGEDSVSHLAVLTGSEYSSPLREATVHHSYYGTFAIRKGKWKLIFDPSSGGWSYPKFNDTKTLKKLPSVQLYDLTKDPGETTNLHAEHPEVLQELTTLMEQYVLLGRSTPGAPQTNDGETIIRRKPLAE